MMKIHPVIMSVTLEAFQKVRTAPNLGTIANSILNSLTHWRKMGTEQGTILPMNERTPLALNVSSVDALTQQLSAARQTRTENTALNIALSLRDPKLIVHPFTFIDVADKDIKSKLTAEAVSLLSLPTSDFVLDFQILKKEAGKTDGIFVCLPKKLLNEYLAVVSKAKATTVKVTAQVIVRMDSFLAHYPDSQDRLCFVDFFGPKMVHLAVFHQRRCELLRELNTDNIEEIYNEIIQSMRSVCGKSFEKKVGHICCAGAIENKEALLKNLEEYFKIKVDQPPAGDAVTSTGNSFFTLNLIGGQVLSRLERTAVIHGLNITVLAVGALCLLAVGNNFYLGHQAKEIRKSYTQKDLEYAKRLKQQLKDLGL